MHSPRESTVKVVELAEEGVLTMRDREYDVVAYEGYHYCVDCLPEGVGPEDKGCDPVFAQSEVYFYPVCRECAALHEYMVKLNANTEEREDADA